MSEIKYVQIGERLREERLRLGISQVDFAAACDASRNALLQWEKGETAPNAGVLALMAGLGVDVLYVVTGTKAGESDSTLAPQERDLLHIFRSTSDQGRAFFRSAVDYVAFVDQRK
ncbi:helix-turn-helix domain-containing protein [Comamonas fluminis]|uniref:helix-turn-helix domain-containing protein n=1 Tax=Comamonas fluminis TaxID=2796366 RepID=UPI001C43C78B|nr:helix-turn-helix transcriptional regulator [Comamonas fluminis]